MKVLHLSNHLRRCGNGIVNHIVDVSTQQALDGHFVCIASSGGEYESELQAEGVRCVHIDQRSASKVLLSLPRLRRLIFTERFDVVHCHMMSGAVMARLACTGAGVVLISTVHNCWQRHAVLMGIADLTVAVSHFVAEEMSRRGIPRRKIRVVHNGLSEPSYQTNADALSQHLEQPAIVSVAGLYERKGIFDLAFAAKRWKFLEPRPHLYFIGDGPDRERLMRMLEEHSLESHVHVLGFRRDVDQLLRHADISVLASHNETFGLSLVESRRAGCPIVATQVGGIPEVLEDGSAGIMVPPHHPDRLAKAVQSLLENEQLRQKIIDGGNSGLGYWTANRMANDLTSVYQEAIEQKHG